MVSLGLIQKKVALFDHCDIFVLLHVLYWNLSFALRFMTIPIPTVSKGLVMSTDEFQVLLLADLDFLGGIIR